MTTQEKIDIMQAWVDGQNVEWRSRGITEWSSIPREPEWDWLYVEYRIKPPKMKRIKYPVEVSPLGYYRIIFHEAAVTLTDIVGHKGFRRIVYKGGLPESVIIEEEA